MHTSLVLTEKEILSVLHFYSHINRKKSTFFSDRLISQKVANAPQPWDQPLPVAHSAPAGGQQRAQLLLSSPPCHPPLQPARIWTWIPGATTCEHVWTDHILWAEERNTVFKLLGAAQMSRFLSFWVPSVPLRFNSLYVSKQFFFLPKTNRNVS